MRELARSDPVWGPQAERRVEQADLFDWLPAHAKQGSVVTSLPDAAELDMTLAEYGPWFRRAVIACFAASSGPTIFKQTDRLAEGLWFSKARELMVVSEQPLLWHKIILRRQPDHTDLHRPTYSHLLCFGPGRPGRRTPDVLDGGRALWPNGIGLRAAWLVARYLSEVGVRHLLNPACGRGTLLAAANAYGIAADGCDVDPECVGASTHLMLDREPIR